MSNFNDQLSRMKALMTYGAVNEDVKPINSYNIEYKAQAADGKYYGIIRENSKFFVKVATPGKETIAEEYQYIGGIANKANYEYNSYANALKQFELKLGSINEAFDENRRVVVEALDPYKKEDLVIEATEKMKNEIARQRQIMRNASVIMNEATEIGSTPFKTQPEAEHEHSGDKDYPFVKKDAKAQPEGDIKFGKDDPEKHSSTFGPDSNDVEDYNLDKGDTPKVKDSVASENPKGGKVARVNESMEECGAACGNMKECGRMAEESDEELLLGDENDEPVETDDLDVDVVDTPEGEEIGAEEDVDVEEPEMGDEEEPMDDEDLDMEDDDELFGDEDLDDEDFDFDDDEDFDFEDDEEFDEEEPMDDEMGEEEPMDDEEEFGEEDFAEEDEPMEADDEMDDPEIELDENVVKKFRQLVRESINEMFGDESGREDCFDQFGRDANDAKFDESLPDEEDDEEGMDRKLSSISEAKAAKMNSIVESVVSDILNEDELHVFGDHPGYRKKPMTLPPTGEDKNEHGEDINDDSVHNEEPFGKGKGDSTPFDILVSQITNSVMKQINENKKKVK